VTGLRVAEGLLAGGNFGRLGLMNWLVLLVNNCTEQNFRWGGLSGSRFCFGQSSLSQGFPALLFYRH
jgi:hypothetical protein